MEIAIVLVVAAILVAVFLLRKGSKKQEPTVPTEAKRPEVAAPAPRVPAQPQAQPAPSEEAPRAAEPTPEVRIPSERPEPAAEIPIEEELPPAPAPVADVGSMRRGLARSRSEEGLFGRLRALFTGSREIDETIASEIEEVLLTSDVGVATTQTILERIKGELGRGELNDEAKVWAALRSEAQRILEVDGRVGGIRPTKKPTVVLLVGVNGAGKTTTIGKLATKLAGEGKQVLLAAGDTFRAAAVQQLKVWGERVGCEVVAGKENSDPSSVVFDAIRRGQELGVDVILADTAGRLHTKANLMAEMEKISRSAAKALPGAPHETLLVIDATNGQNALAQAKEFAESLELSGIVLTKLDGTAKGGVILGICDTLRLPVRYVGLGERPDDLHEFSPEAFVEALLGRDEKDAAA